MTTLPQTTTIRLPRPTGGGQLVAAHPGAASSAPGGMTGADVWRVIRANMWIILLFLVVGMVVGYVGNKLLEKYYSRYTAVAYIQINSQSGLPGASALMTESVGVEQKTQASMMRNDTLISRLIQQGEESPYSIRQLAYFHRFHTPDELKVDLLSNIAVDPIADTKLIRVSITAPYKEDARDLLKAYIGLHIKEQGEAATSSLTNQRAALTKVKTRIEAQLRSKQEEIKSEEDKMNGDSGLGGINRLSFKELELQQLLNHLSEVQSDLQTIQSRAENLKATFESGQDPIEIQERVESDPDVRGYHTTLDNLDLERMSTVQRYGPNSQFVEGIDQKSAIINKKLSDKTGQIKALARLEMQGAMEQDIANKQNLLGKLMNKKAGIQTEMQDLANSTSELSIKQEEEKGLRGQVNDIGHQIENVDNLLTQTMVNKISWSNYPDTPSAPSFPKLQYTMTISILTALALSLGVALLREAMDQTVRSPRDIARVGQMNLLGMVPDESDDPQSAGARLPLVIFDAPHSIMAEQFRQVRTKLQHAASLDTTRSMMITSPAPGDGKTTIAANLAAGLALNGRRILLVDANFRRPEIHKIFGFHNEQGFSDVLNGTVDFEEMAQETQVPNLAVMTSGPKPVNATELFESQLLIDFIERALEEYDHVIFDSGPMLVVSESVAMAPRVDGVVTVVRARANSRGLLTRMRDSLRQIKAEHLGVVLNAVKSQGGGYYGRNIRTYYEYENV